nr:MAG TPA: hypothetical protein [Caudoviricetes sp.]
MPVFLLSILYLTAFKAFLKKCSEGKKRRKKGEKFGE